MSNPYTDKLPQIISEYLASEDFPHSNILTIAKTAPYPERARGILNIIIKWLQTREEQEGFFGVLFVGSVAEKEIREALERFK